MSVRRNARHYAFVAAVLAVFAGGFALTLTLSPMPTDAAAGPAAGVDAGCEARVAQVHRSFGVSLTRLANVGDAGPAERCVAYRTHLATIETARVVYGSCMTGFARDDQMGQLDLAYSDWRAAIDTRCAE
jgi:hypothetical protein